jgi:hypothetical protein
MSTAQQENKMNRTQPIKSINVENITFQVGKAQAGRNPSVSMKLNGQPFNIGLRNMRAPGGINRRENEGAPDAFTLMVGLPGCPRDGVGLASAEAAADGSGEVEMTDAQAFYNFLRALEPKMLAAATENSAKWFGRSRSKAAVEDGLKRLVNISSTKGPDGEYVPNGKYDPSVRVKVPIYDGQVKCAVEDGAKNPVYLGSPDDLVSAFPKGAGLNLVVSGNIYILAGGGFGVTWRLGAAQVFPPSRPRLTDFFEAVEVAPASGGGGGGGGGGGDEEDDHLSQGGASAVSSGATPGVMYGGGGGGGQDRPATPEGQTPAPASTAAPGRKRRGAA